MIKQTIFAAAMAVAATAAFAQSDTTPQQFVDKAAASDMFEIESSKLALQRSQMPATRALAEHMITDHSATSARLSSIVAGTSLTVPTRMDSAHEQMMARLANASSGEFDAAYIMAQQSVHKAAVEMFTTYSASGTEPALKAYAEEPQPALRNHRNAVDAMK